MTHQDRHEKAITEWTALFKAGKLECKPFNLSELPPSTYDYLETIVLPSGLPLLQGPTIEGMLLIQIVGDDVVGYMAHCPECATHTWGAPDFGDVEPNDVLARLFTLSDKCQNMTEAETKEALDTFDNTMIQSTASATIMGLPADLVLRSNPEHN